MDGDAEETSDPDGVAGSAEPRQATRRRRRPPASPRRNIEMVMAGPCIADEPETYLKRGSDSRNVAPAPTWLVPVRRPPFRAARLRAIARPRPLPSGDRASA